MKTIRNKWRLEEDKEKKWIIKTWSLSASLWRIQEEHLVFWTFQRKVAGDFITVWSRETLRGREWWSDWLLAFLSKEKVYQSPMRQVYQCLKFTKSELCVLEEGKRWLLVLSDFPNENEHKRLKGLCERAWLEAAGGWTTRWAAGYRRKIVRESWFCSSLGEYSLQ